MSRASTLWISLTLLFLAAAVYLGASGGEGKEQADAGTSTRMTALPLPDSATIRRVHRRADEIRSIRSLLIQKGGVLISEQYFDGMSAGETANLKSASKSIVSLLVGIAIDKKIIQSVEQPIADFFPEISDSLKKKITVQDLLTMRSGLETTSFHNYGRWVTSDDWVEYTLEQPMVDRPGSDMEYSTGTSHLLSVIIEKAAEMSTLDFADKYLFGPLGIQPGDWQRDPQGYYFGGNNMALKPTDMVKIGQMVLNGGTYDGKRIVSEDWIEASLATYTRSNYNPYDYGYMWWNKMVGGHKAYFAWGYGGQYIFVIPQLDAVVVITSSLRNATQRRRYKRPIFNLMEDQVIPLLRGQVEQAY
ncbi:MAG: serine hydrolase [Balneolaceae bacterium]|nr:serine hydrolase [Balneolaceae bacterium]